MNILTGQHQLADITTDDIADLWASFQALSLHLQEPHPASSLIHVFADWVEDQEGIFSSARRHCYDFSRAHSWGTLTDYAEELYEQCPGIESAAMAFTLAGVVLADYETDDVDGTIYYSHPDFS